jgi:hypothetical protein
MSLFCASILFLLLKNPITRKRNISSLLFLHNYVDLYYQSTYSKSKLKEDDLFGVKGVRTSYKQEQRSLCTKECRRAFTDDGGNCHRSTESTMLGTEQWALLFCLKPNQCKSPPVEVAWPPKSRHRSHACAAPCTHTLHLRVVMSLPI